MEIGLMAVTADETRDLGEALAALLRAGDLVSLTGEPGAGKTTFVQGVGRGLGVETAVVSPTFTLIREYEGRLHVHHLDVYRLARIQDVIDLGFEEMVDGDGVTFVEWGGAIEGMLREEYLQVDLTVPDESERRRIRFIPIGPSWIDRADALAAATRGWAS